MSAHAGDDGSRRVELEPPAAGMTPICAVKLLAAPQWPPRPNWSTMAAFGKRCRVKGANQAGLATARTHYEKSWPDFAIADVTQPLVEKAGMYAEAFALRGYDSVQLAAAMLLQLGVLA